MCTYGAHGTARYGVLKLVLRRMIHDDLIFCGHVFYGQSMLFQDVA